MFPRYDVLKWCLIFVSTLLIIRTPRIMYQTVDLTRLVYKASFKIGRASGKRRVHPFCLSKIFWEIQMTGNFLSNMLQNMKNVFTPSSLKFEVYLYACTNCKIPMSLILTMLLIEKLAFHSFNCRHVEVETCIWVK